MAAPASPFHYEQRRLENDFVALELFDVDKYAARFVEGVVAHPEMFAYLSFPLMNTVDDFLNEVYNGIAASPADCLYAVIDKTKNTDSVEDSFAGVVSLNDTSKEFASTELGILLFPKFHRSHVASNAIGLSLLYLLDPPSQGGLGLRRVLWQANVKNEPSRRLASRMGFELEGVLRWRRTLPPIRACQEGQGEDASKLAARNGTRPEDEPQGRHTAVYSLVWDEWDEKRPGVVALMVVRK
ncbi:hypothetical protein SEUCBS139899_002586 [Sporothrix eucalyptigena]|uniref:N-acetyltransferase domain-containing protein n=1 Tax=Sporothrix eucalyptigena TaxID=1812306 RepID=A0ABP0BJX9_9PEZI